MTFHYVILLGVIFAEIAFHHENTQND